MILEERSHKTYFSIMLSVAVHAMFVVVLLKMPKPEVSINPIEITPLTDAQKESIRKILASINKDRIEEDIVVGDIKYMEEMDVFVKKLDKEIDAETDRKVQEELDRMIVNMEKDLALEMEKIGMEGTKDLMIEDDAGIPEIIETGEIFGDVDSGGPMLMAKLDDSGGIGEIAYTDDVGSDSSVRMEIYDPKFKTGDSIGDVASAKGGRGVPGKGVSGKSDPEDGFWLKEGSTGILVRLKNRTLISHVAPEIPRTENVKVKELIVSVEVSVMSNGYVKKTVIDKSSGYESIDKAVTDALMKWRFSPLKSEKSTQEQIGIIEFTIRFN